MKKAVINLKLYGPSGDLEPWVIEFGKTYRDSKGKWLYGYVDWTRRKIVINYRLKNEKVIQDTITHECGHVTAGQNASEEFIINMEKNNRKLQDLYEKLKSQENR